LQQLLIIFLLWVVFIYGHCASLRGRGRGGGGVREHALELFSSFQHHLFFLWNQLLER
jgi:hypothetical protein